MPTPFPLPLETSGSPALFWCWGVATLLLASALGFAAGAMYGNRSADRSLRKATQAPSLLGLTIGYLERAHQAATRLEALPDTAIPPQDLERLEARRSSLLETIARLLTREQDRTVKPVEEPAAPSPLVPFRVEWSRSSIDVGTGLPDRATFDENLRKMLEVGTAASGTSGLLFVRIDRMDHLKARFGLLGADLVTKMVAGVISRAIREQDLACRLGPDSFAVLVPSVDAEHGRKLAQAVRNSVRVQTFRLGESGPEVMVTASFGYTTCAPRDEPEFALTRAANALARSISRGRNQLHAVEGDAVVQCTGS